MAAWSETLENHLVYMNYFWWKDWIYFPWDYCVDMEILVFVSFAIKNLFVRHLKLNQFISVRYNLKYIYKQMWDFYKDILIHTDFVSKAQKFAEKSKWQELMK